MAITLRQRTPVKQSLSSARDIAAAIIAAAEQAPEGVRAELDLALGHGVYTLNEPIVLDAAEHPALAGLRLTVRAEDGMRPVFSSLRSIDTRAFVKVKDNIYRYQFEKGEDGKYPVFRDFYCGDTRVPLASGEIFVNPFGLPDRKDRDDPENYKGFYMPYEEVARLAAWDSIAPAEIAMNVEWNCYNAHIERVDLSDTCEHEGKRYARIHLPATENDRLIHEIHPQLDIRNRETFFHNHPAYLTAHTYSYDCKMGVLYYCLPEGESIEYKRFAYPTLENLWILRGMNDVCFEGITFTGTTSKCICENLYYAGQSNKERKFGVLPHAAILTSGVRGFTVTDCTFRDLGGNGILMTNRSVKVRIHSNRFMRVAMSAIIVGNYSKDWTDPNTQNINVEIVNNYLHIIGYEYPSAGGIFVGKVDRLKIMYNTIEKTAYSGITVGWGWSRVEFSLGEQVNIRDAEIAYNHITDFMLKMRDGAAIYVLGANCTWEHEARFNRMHDNYAARELYKDSSKRGYYMDGSSTNWEVWDNVISGVRLPIFSQFHVSGQYTHHNHIHDIYTDYPIDRGNHAPWRDTVLGECYYVAEGLEALLETYPKARMIRDYAGCDLEI